jgi:DNA-directed RNA polymerase specialized sigma24 family protein
MPKLPTFLIFCSASLSRNASKLRLIHVKVELERAHTTMGKSMKVQTLSGPGAYDSDSGDEFLAAHDVRIQSEARRAIPLGFFSEDVIDLEVDDLAQNIRIKLWASYQQRPITHPGGYIRTIAHTTAIDMVRRHRPTVSLFEDADGELCPGDRLAAQNEGFQDPAYEIELGEIDTDFLTKLMTAILALPPRQKQAMLYALKDCRDYALPLINALKVYGIDIEAMDWPDEPGEVQLLKASLPFARKKLRWILAEFMDI